MNRIKDLREDMGWKQSDLGERLGVKQQAVSKYERNDVDLDTETIRRLCGIFGCTSDYLLGLSAVRTAQVSDADAALLAAYYAAPESIRKGIRELLQPYFEQETSSASQDAQGGD